MATGEDKHDEQRRSDRSARTGACEEGKLRDVLLQNEKASGLDARRGVSRLERRLLQSGAVANQREHRAGISAGVDPRSHARDGTASEHFLSADPGGGAGRRLVRPVAGGWLELMSLLLLVIATVGWTLYTKGLQEELRATREQLRQAKEALSNTCPPPADHLEVIIASRDTIDQHGKYVLTCLPVKASARYKWR